MRERVPFQAAYQRNLLKSLLTVIGLALIFAAALQMRIGVSGETAGLGTSEGTGVSNESGEPGGRTPLSLSRSHALPAGAPLSGFLGFDVRVVSDNAVPEVTISSARTQPPDMLLPDDELSETWASPMFAGDGVSGPPGGGQGPAYFWGQDWGHYPRVREPVNRDVAVVNSIEPEYPLVARMSDKEGSVVVLICVDSLGRRSPFSCKAVVRGERQRLEFYVDGSESDTLEEVVLSEDPEGWYFAHKTLQALRHWSFSPAIHNSTPESRFLEITYHYRLLNESGVFQIRSIDDNLDL